MPTLEEYRRRQKRDAEDLRWYGDKHQDRKEFFYILAEEIELRLVK